MLTTTVAGRTWNFSHAIGRNAAMGAGFTQPVAVAVPRGGELLYVLSRGQEGGAGGLRAETKRIGKVSFDQEFIGDFGRRDFIWPAGLAVSSEGDVYCSDEFAHHVARYSADGQRLGEWGEPGSGEGQLNGPSGIAFDADDNLYVVDSLNDRVQKFSPDGTFLLCFGGPQDVGAELDHPAGVAVDSEGDVYVTDWGNKLVRIYDPSGATITSLEGDAQEVSKWGQAVIAANPDGASAYRRVRDLTPFGRFERPVGIAVDSQDRIIITDSTRGRIQIYAKDKDYKDPQFNL